MTEFEFNLIRLFPDIELKEKITRWKNEKAKQRAAASSDSSSSKASSKDGRDEDGRGNV